MGLRPAKTCRTLDKTAWTRFSKRKPRKSYVKAMPHTNLLNFRMGVRESADYDANFELCTKDDVQLRDNALEAARQAANKYLEKQMLNQYYFHVLVIPHNVIRENKMIAGAGADRLQKGMRAAFGRAMDKAARVRSGQAIFSIRTKAANREKINEAYRRAVSKLSGKWHINQKIIAA